MKCRVDIQKAIVKKAMEKFETKNVRKIEQNKLFINNDAFLSGSKQSYMVARSVADRADKFFKGKVAHVTSYDHGQAITFMPSQDLVTKYYEHYLTQYYNAKQEVEETMTEEEERQMLQDAKRLSREDALRAGEQLSENYEQMGMSAQEDIFIEMDNLNFTPAVLEYLYGESSGRLDFNNFASQVKILAANLRGMNYSSQEILDKINCM
jgi:hypothetical protein